MQQQITICSRGVTCVEDKDTDDVSLIRIRYRRVRV
jgi:hypothetical protein